MHKLVTVRQKKSIIIVISFLASYGYVYRETQLSNAVQISEKNDFSLLVSLSNKIFRLLVKFETVWLKVYCLKSEEKLPPYFLNIYCHLLKQSKRHSCFLLLQKKHKT